jgi:uncharacterized protein (DUF58 family)
MQRRWLIFALLTAVAFAAWWTGNDILLRLTYVIALIVAGSFLWAWTSLRWTALVRITRTHRSQVGKMVEESFEVTNTGFLPKFWLEVHDHSTLPGHRTSRVISALPAHRHQNWSVRTMCRKRGEFALGPITIRAGDPLGLFHLERHLESVSTIVVYPATVDLPGFVPPAGQLPGGEAMRRRTHHITTNVSGTREYVPGDSFNRIHWRSTARTGRLIVKEFELDPLADVWIFLDMEAQVQAGVALEESLGDADFVPPWLMGKARLASTTEEYAVTAAASLARHFLNQNRAVGLTAYGQRLAIVPLDRTQRQLAKILETLAVLRAEGDVPLAEIVAAQGARLSRNLMAIIVTPSTEQSWVVAMRGLLRREIRVAVVLLDASTFHDSLIPPDRQPSTTSATALAAALMASRIPTYVIKKDELLEIALTFGVGGRG